MTKISNIGAFNNLKLKYFYSKLHGSISRAFPVLQSLRITTSTALSPVMAPILFKVNPFGDLREVCLDYDFIKDTDLSHFDFRRASFKETKILGCDLKGADLRGAYLFNTNFGSSILDGAKFDGAKLTNNNFGDASLIDVSFCKINANGKINLVGADIEGTTIKLEDLKYFVLTPPAEEENIPDRTTERLRTIIHDEATSSAFDLKSCLLDLSIKAKKGKIDPVIGREKEIDGIIQILLRKTKCNPVLIGDAGVGKTAIVEGLAQRIFDKKVPEELLNKKIVCLDIGSLLAGTKYRGEFEERLKKLIDEIKNNKDLMLFIDELHNIVNAGGAHGELNVANILKPVLSRGEIQCIGATTIQEYRKHIEKDGALERRFQQVVIDEPSIEKTIDILYGLRSYYENYHGVKITDGAIEAAAYLSARYITDRFLPDKAIDLIDEASAKAKIDKSSVVDVSAIAREVSDKTKIPLGVITDDEGNWLLSMEDIIGQMIFGQDEAVSAVSKAVRRRRMGLGDSKRPVGSFVFLGPTGVGKTELANALEEFLFGSDKHLIRIDMSEYMEKHSSSRLIGSPPGYVGHEEAGQLTEAVRRKPYSVVLFDGIENAHPDVFDLLLQVVDDGRLTDSNGKVVNFRDTIIIMTSNLASVEELKQKLKPEFLNRIDEAVVFNPLSKNNLYQIVDRMLGEVSGRLLQQGISVKYLRSAKDFLIKKGYKLKTGARELKRAIEKYIADPISTEILKGTARNGNKIVVKYEKGKIQIKTFPLHQ